MKKKWIIVLIIIFGVLLRLYKINSPLADISAWRQVDTDSIARNFLRLKFNIFYPQLNYDGPPPNYAELEFQLVPFLIALLYKLGGIKVIWARLVPVVFGAGSIYLLYLLTREVYDEQTAYLSAFTFAVLPLNIYFQRAVMPESAMIFFSVGSLYFFDQWIKTERKKDYCWAVFFFAFALLIKLPTGILVLPLFFLAYEKFGLSLFRRGEIYLFGILTFSPTLIYYFFLHQIASHTFVSGIAKEQVFSNFFSSIFESDNLSYVLNIVCHDLLTPIGSILFVAGLIYRRRDKKEVLIYSWTVAVIVYLLVIVTKIHLEYYVLPLAPVAAILIGKILTVFFKNKDYICLGLVFISYLLIQSYQEIRYYYVLDREILNRGAEVNSLTPQESLIIIDELSPVLLHASDRMGWRIDRKELTIDLVEELKNKGADYYVPARTPLSGEIKNYFEENYEVISTPSGLEIYGLHR
ncbi:MAG TPA: phospholipid carrier-dependent glycosyltransferase [Clostridia bacterium]|nr:phospholipid carrier-dependent glycosyltransferase [Clostridia bacterium]